MLRVCPERFDLHRSFDRCPRWAIGWREIYIDLEARLPPQALLPQASRANDGQYDLFRILAHEFRVNLLTEFFELGSSFSSCQRHGKTPEKENLGSSVSVAVGRWCNGMIAVDAGFNVRSFACIKRSRRVLAFGSIFAPKWQVTAFTPTGRFQGTHHLDT